jgi:hypothetical protein
MTPRCGTNQSEFANVNFEVIRDRARKASGAPTQSIFTACSTDYTIAKIDQ